MRYYIPFFCVLLITAACNSAKKRSLTNSASIHSHFSGNYSASFDDLPDLHIQAAQSKGVTPLPSRADTTQWMFKLVHIPNEIALYKIDKLTNSIPFLVTDASDLLTEICVNFRDSLIRERLPLYKPIITSMMRTNEDVELLRKRNSNAVENSAHCYGTTFDISWKRFESLTTDTDDCYNEKLKLALAQVLNNLRVRNLCYVKYERKQACFHITVR